MARIAGVNIPQTKVVHVALTYIYGIGKKFSDEICTKLNIPRDKRANSLTEDEILKISSSVKLLALLSFEIFSFVQISSENFFPIP